MKQFSLALVFLMTIFCAANAQTQSKSFKVSGVCGMCKKKIEAAAVKAGVQSAEWNISTQIISIEYEGSATSIEKVQSAIAEAGYDNEGAKASDTAYDGLHECCKYRESSKSGDKGCCAKKKSCKKSSNNDSSLCCKSEGKEDVCKKGDKASCTKEGKKSKDCCKH